MNKDSINGAVEGTINGVLERKEWIIAGFEALGFFRYYYSVVWYINSYINLEYSLIFISDLCLIIFLIFLILE